MAIDSPPAAGNAERLRWAFERLSAHDIASLRQFWTDSTVARFPDRTCVGADEAASYFQALIDGISDLRMEVQAIVEQGDDVFVRWHMTGTHRGRVQGVDGTGRPIAVDGIDHLVVRGGKVVSNLVVTDRLQWAQQMGMMPPDGSTADRAAKRLFNTRTALLRRLRR